MQELNCFVGCHMSRKTRTVPDFGGCLHILASLTFGNPRFTPPSFMNPHHHHCHPHHLLKKWSFLLTSAAHLRTNSRHTMAHWLKIDLPATQVCVVCLHSACESFSADSSQQPCKVEHPYCRWGGEEIGDGRFWASNLLSSLPTGYGHTVPHSDWGKIICIFYAFLGIPLTLMFLSCLLQYLLPLVTYRPVRYIHRRWGFSADRVALAHAVLLGLVTVGLFILIPAICFSALEGNWSFLESVYFCFISLSTIGLGDYIPQGALHPHLHELYKVSITCKSLGSIDAHEG